MKNIYIILILTLFINCKKVHPTTKEEKYKFFYGEKNSVVAVPNSENKFMFQRYENNEVICYAILAKVFQGNYHDTGGLSCKWKTKK